MNHAKQCETKSYMPDLSKAYANFSHMQYVSDF